MLVTRAEGQPGGWVGFDFDSCRWRGNRGNKGEGPWRPARGYASGVGRGCRLQLPRDNAEVVIQRANPSNEGTEMARVLVRCNGFPRT